MKTSWRLPVAWLPKLLDNALVSDYRGYLTLLLYAMNRIGLMTTLPYAQAFLQQFNEFCLRGVGAISRRAGSLGFLIVAAVLTLLAADTAFAMRILVIVVFREGGPLLAALILLLKVGTENTATLSMRWNSGEANYLENIGLRAWDYLVVPRVFAVIGASVVLTFYFQLLAALGALLGGPLFLDATLAQLFDQFAGELRLADVGYTLLKSLLFGAIIATVSCHHGVAARGTRAIDHRSALSQSLLRAFFLVTFCNALFAYVFYGVLLFGMIRSAV